MRFLKQVHSRNFINLSLNQGVNILVALIVTPYVFQTLGEDTFGVVNLSLSIIMLFSILVNYGFHLNGPKRLALVRHDIVKKEELINEILWTRLTVSLLLFISIIICVNVFGLFDQQAIILLFSTIILFSEAVFPMFILQGLDRISWIAYGNVATKIIYGVSIFLVIQSPSEVRWVNFLFGASALFINVILLCFVYKAERVRLRLPQLGALVGRFKENFEYFFSTIAGHISIHGGVVILSNFVTDAQLGKYALAQRVAFLLRLVPTFVIQSILQQASIFYQTDKTQYHSYLKRAYKYSLVITFIIGVFFSLSAPMVIRIVGGEYVDFSADLLKVMAFIPFASALNVKNMIEILATELKSELVKATWLTAFFMVIASILGSYYFGAMGLAIALLITEVVNFIVHRVILKRMKKQVYK